MKAKVVGMPQADIVIDGATTTIQLNEKEFKTGSTGYHGQGKLATNAGRYQVNVIAVLIGSKPKGK